MERTGARTVTVTEDDPLRLGRTFVAIIAPIPSIMER